MTFPAWIAAIVLFLQLPIPLYWFVLHPARNFWSTRRNAAYITGLLLSWPPVTIALIIFHRELFRRAWPPAWQLALGLALISLEVWIFWHVKRDLGTARLVGATELSGGGQIAQTGIYARIRHPRYVGSFLSIVGVCTLAATRGMWIVAVVWTFLTGLAIALEETELRARFGASYQEYCRGVPRFLPRVRSPRRVQSSRL
jgi:protein-S-isoprenylcysteine O-methyltransferase Ste14